MAQWTPIGEFQHPVEVQVDRNLGNPDAARNAMGETTPDWRTVYRTRCKYAPLTGRAFIAAKQVQAETSVLVRMRYWPGLTGRHRLLLHTGQTLYLSGPPRNVEGRNREWELDCSEGTP